MTTTGSAGRVSSAAAAQASRRREIATLGAYSMHAQYDGKAVSARSMDTRMRRYREQVDPSGELARRNPQELARRAQAALNADMARVRLAKRDRAVTRARLHTMMQRTPSDDLPMLGAELVALELNARATARLAVDEAEIDALRAAHTAQNSAQNEAAPVGTEAAPTSRPTRNTQIIVSSDGGVASIAPTRRRRQTSTPKSAPVATSKKAAKSSHGNSSKQQRTH